MIFSSLLFLFLFLPLALLIALLITLFGKRFSNMVLFLASLIFCAWGGVSYTAILLVSILINYCGGLLIGNMNGRSGKYVFIIFIVLNLGLLLFFKYSFFLMDNINGLFPGLHTDLYHLRKMLLPLGISFYTFKALSYLFSVHRNECKPDKNFINLGLYISFFPQLAAGPIDRYNNLHPQILHREITIEKFASGVKRFALGLAKKVLISAPLAATADQVFGSKITEIDTPMAWLGIACYTLQIYYDFSGYTDMAIGIGRMTGFSFVENFNFPYISKSVREFWQRWHMSLSSWLRDYLFLPLAYSFSRKFKKESYISVSSNLVIYIAATLITFFVCGFWHGAAWNFIIWGMLHGLFLVIEKTPAGKRLRKAPLLLQHFYLLLFLMVSWVFFRTETPADSFSYLKVMFGGSEKTINLLQTFSFFNKGFILVMVVALLGCTRFFTVILSSIKNRISLMKKIPAVITNNFLEFASFVFVVFVMVMGTILINSGTINPFLYFKF